MILGIAVNNNFVPLLLKKKEVPMVSRVNIIDVVRLFAESIYITDTNAVRNVISRP